MCLARGLMGCIVCVCVCGTAAGTRPRPAAWLVPDKEGVVPNRDRRSMQIHPLNNIRVCVCEDCLSSWLTSARCVRVHQTCWVCAQKKKAADKVRRQARMRLSHSPVSRLP